MPANWGLVLNNGGCKLSNSGDTLKLTILSICWKIYSGWTNYSGIVTSCKITEKWMGYRGSKSISNIVKEQRVEGSYLFYNKLRCILMVFERKYLTNNHSKFNLHPWFITGLTDAEGCFTIKIGKRIQFEYVITLHFSPGKN